MSTQPELSAQFYLFYDSEVGKDNSSETALNWQTRYVTPLVGHSNLEVCNGLYRNCLI